MNKQSLFASPLRLVAIVIVAFTFLIAGNTSAQTYFGAGYATVEYGIPFKTDPDNGVAITIQHEIPFNTESRWSIVPTLNMAVCIDNEERTLEESSNGVSLSLSPVVAYNVINKSKFTLSPFAGPSFTYFNVLTTFNDEESIVYSVQDSDFRYGFEFGIMATYKITDNFHVRAVPFSGNGGNNRYSRMNFSLLFSL